MWDWPTQTRSDLEAADFVVWGKLWGEKPFSPDVEDILTLDRLGGSRAGESEHYMLEGAMVSCSILHRLSTARLDQNYRLWFVILH